MEKEKYEIGGKSDRQNIIKENKSQSTKCTIMFDNKKSKAIW